MKKKFFLILSFCLLVGCSSSKEVNNVVTTQQSDDKVNVSLSQEFADEYDISDITYNISQYFQEYFENANFSARTEDEFLFAGKTVNYDVYYGSDKGLKIELNTEDESFTELEQQPESSIYYFDIDSQYNISLRIMEVSTKLDYEKVGTGTFSIGEAYSPQYENFEGKDEMLKNMKECLEKRYFESEKCSEKPLFSETTEAKKVFLLNFNEVNVDENHFTVLVYTQDNSVFMAEMVKNVADNSFSCEEIMTDEIHTIEDYENSDDSKMVLEGEYHNRIIENAILTLTE